MLGQGAWAAAEYHLFAPETEGQLRDAMGGSFNEWPTQALIDLQTMTVVVQDCFYYPQQGNNDQYACVEDHI